MVSEDGGSSARLAVLIDADNVQPAIAARLLAEIVKYGTAFVKRAYGDWTGTRLKGAKLSDLIDATALFDLDWRKPAAGKSNVVYARDKRYQPAKKPA